MANDISSSIINQLGGGSGIDTKQLVDQLVELERAPTQNRLDQREAKLEAQISALGLVRSAMDEFGASLDALANPDTFNAKQASISDTMLMAVNSLNPEAVPGNYRIRVEQVAQSQSLSSGQFESTSSPVGTGSLTIRFGDWDDGAFTLDASAEGATIEINESNNSLRGLRDAINAADIGVQASIVGQNGSYQLLLTGPTGATREMEITATEGDVAGLSAFNFNEADQQFTQQQEGKDAILSINGLQVSRNSNVISDVIEGVEFEVFNSNPDEEISINITEDRSMAEQAIRDFVDSYNTFIQQMQFLQSNEEGEDGQGSLRGDPIGSNVVNTIREMMSGSVPALDDAFSSLASIGIVTKKDGTLEIPSNGWGTDFDKVFDQYYDQVKDIFIPRTSSSDSRLDVFDYSERTQAGTYEVEITQHATRGTYSGVEGALAGGFPLDTTGKDYSFVVAIDGRETAEITLPEDKVYNSGAELAKELQTLMNSDAALKESNTRVNISFDDATGTLNFESGRYGASSKIDFLSLGADMADFGINEGAGTTGQDVQGTINGREGMGFGNILRAYSGGPTEGLAVEVAPGVDTATINFSWGLGASLKSAVDSFTSNSGFISEREETLGKNLSGIEEDREALDRRIEAFRARQEAQFLAMERIVRSLNSSGDFLDGIIDRLPFTAPKG